MDQAGPGGLILLAQLRRVAASSVLSLVVRFAHDLVTGTGRRLRSEDGALSRRDTDFSPFIKMRRLQLDPESVVGKELLDRFAEFDHSFAGHSRIWGVVVNSLD